MFQNYVFSFYNTLASVELELENPIIWENLSIYCGIFDYHLNAIELRDKFFSELKKCYENNVDTPYYEANYEDILLRLFHIKKLKGKNKTPKELGRFFHILAVQNLNLFPDTKKLLEQLQKEEKNIYLLANAQKSFVKDELRYFGLKKYFKSIYVSSEYSIKKPNVTFFNQVISENKLEKKKTLFVGGDYEIDLLPAQKLGYATCLVLEGEKKSEYSEQADFIVEKRKLKQILEF